MNNQRPTQFEQAMTHLERRVNYENFQGMPYQELSGRLERLRELLVELGSPEKRFLTVHVAGTKGKGSACTLLKSILRQAGYRVGFFSSPHLYSLLERFAIDGESCDAEEFGELMLWLRDRVKNREKSWKFTYFELTTLFAFEYFARKKVDVAVLEVGLGGRWDATNVCSPTVTVITNISFDHIEQLGPTLGAIAEEKAGIIKPGIPVVAGPEGEEARQVIQRTAKNVGAPYFFLDEDFSIASEEPEPAFRFFPLAMQGTLFREVDSLLLKLHGNHQRNNAALAIAAAQLLENHLKVSDSAIRSGLAAAFLPVRIELFRPLPDSPTFVVDGAHNRASIVALVQTLKSLRPFRKKYLVFGTSLGKDCEGMLSELLPFFDHVVLTQHSSNPRRFPPQGLLTILSMLTRVPQSLRQLLPFPTPVDVDPAQGKDDDDDELGIDIVEHPFLALEKCWNMAKRDDLVCVCGSMYLAGELRQFFIESIAVQVPGDRESVDTPRL